MKEKIVAIVLAAGRGKRMGSQVPKQYLDLQGKPVLWYSLEIFQNSVVDEILLVTAEEEIPYCKKEIVEKYGFTKVKQIVAGGAERYLSVYEGLKKCEGAAYCLIHDGARPFVTNKMIEDSIKAVKEHGAVVCGMPVKDTIKKRDNDFFAAETIDRNVLWQIQTPQSFSVSLLQEAYEKLFTLGEEVCSRVTDDAMVVELTLNKRVKLIEGNYQNIKVTTPEDLAIGKVFAENLKTAQKKP